MFRISVLLVWIILWARFGAAQFYAPYGGPFTSQGDLRFLLIYAGFENKGCVAENDPYFHHGMWPSTKQGEQDCNTFPAYAHELFYGDFTQFGLDKTDKSISNFYYQMTRNSSKPLRIVADVFPERINIEGTFPNNREVFKKIQEKYPNFDWSKYDLRKNNPKFLNDHSSFNPDHEIDYVVVIWRKFGSGGYANTDLFNFTTHARGYPETYKVTAGFTMDRGMGDNVPKNAFHHEVSHSLFNCPHIFHANGVYGDYFYTSEGWGLMRYGSINSSANAWESWYNGWIDLAPQKDLKDYTQNGIYTLKDFINTGDAMRIKLPFSNQSLWIENHTGLNVFDDRDAFILGGLGDSIPKSDKGLFMFVENITDRRDKIIYPLSPQYANGLKALHAGGNYDYEVNGFNLKDPQWWGNVVVDFKQASPNPTGGHHDLTPVRANYTFDTIFPDKIIYRRFTNNSSESCQMCESASGRYAQEAYDVVKKNGKYIYGILGVGMAFGNGNLPQKIGMSHNPMILNHQKYICPDKLEPIYLHGISITILSKASNGDITFEVKFDDTEINADQRFTGDLILKDIPNAEYDLLIKKNKTLLLDKSGTANRYNKGKLIDGMYEFPDFINPSILTVDSAAKLFVEEDAVLKVAKGSTLRIKSGATLVVKGKLEVEEGSYLCVEPEADLQISGPLKKKIRLHKKAFTGINPKLYLGNTSFMEISEIRKKIKKPNSLK